jgi:signal transduction histidine kinase
MKKVALVFVLAVFVPSLVLAWLAVRSLRDQQFLLERQQSLLYQGVTDAIAQQVQDNLAEFLRNFTVEVAALSRDGKSQNPAKSFDEALRRVWPLAQVGFAVTLTGEILSPSPYGGPDARKFCADNGRFLANREIAEVYWNPKQVLNFNNAAIANIQSQQSSLSQADASDAAPGQRSVTDRPQPQALNSSAQRPTFPSQEFANPQIANAQPAPFSQAQTESNTEFDRRYSANRLQQTRKVSPQQQAGLFQKITAPEDNLQAFSKVAASEAEFRQLIGEGTEGALARFVDNKLNVLFWCRPASDSNLVFGAQLALPRLIQGLQGLIQQVQPALREEICVALLDDTAKPVALSHPSFHAAWKRPFVATEIGETLPHWEVAGYLLNPAKLTQTARTLKLTLGLLIGVLVLAIGIGSWLIVADLNRQLTLARQKTDFVSNVSHELKTPLTSIRMFSELLAEGRVNDPAKQRSYLSIITAETARLTRLINNVLDFARIERGEKKYHFQKCDLVSVVRETATTYRPHLEANGFQFDCELPAPTIFVHGDRDALAQVIVNLLSNAEKYSDSRKEIELRVVQEANPLPYVEIRVSDRGVGVPEGSEQKIFEQFYRAHDSLSSGIQGSGLGLTLARQIARAHGGEVVYEKREGGGSYFSLRLPLMLAEQIGNPRAETQHTAES